MRRSKPVARQVIPPFRPTKALLQGRLIDFDTGSAELEQQHREFLYAAMKRATANSAYHVRIFGFASRLGDAGKNQALSLARMNKVVDFLKKQDGRVYNSLEMFEAFGESRSGGGEKDDSPEFRAVEVHIFIGDAPPLDPPPGKKVEPRSKPALPGGLRSGRWSVATPGGATFTLGPSVGPLSGGGAIGGNFFLVRNELTGVVRKYVALALGAGASVGLPGAFKSLKNALQTVLTGPNVPYAGASFTPVFPPHPLTFEEVDSCSVTVVGANAGNPLLSGAVAVVTFHCPGVMQFGPSGTPVRVPEDIWSFNSAERNIQLGAGASGVTGPLIVL